VPPDRGARAGWLDRTPLCFRTLASRVAVSPSESDDGTSSFAVLENELENDSEKFEIHSLAPFFAFDDRICKYDCVLLILSTKDPVENARGSHSRLQDAYKISLTGESHGLAEDTYTSVAGASGDRHCPSNRIPARRSGDRDSASYKTPVFAHAALHKSEGKTCQYFRCLLRICSTLLPKR
jgi:hypothetical protein